MNYWNQSYLTLAKTFYIDNTSQCIENRYIFLIFLDNKDTCYNLHLAEAYFSVFNIFWVKRSICKFTLTQMYTKAYNTNDEKEVWKWNVIKSNKDSLQKLFFITESAHPGMLHRTKFLSSPESDQAQVKLLLQQQMVPDGLFST